MDANPPKLPDRASVLASVSMRASRCRKPAFMGSPPNVRVAPDCSRARSLPTALLRFETTVSEAQSRDLMRLAQVPLNQLTSPPALLLSTRDRIVPIEGPHGHLPTQSAESPDRGPSGQRHQERLDHPAGGRH